MNLNTKDRLQTDTVVLKHVRAFPALPQIILVQAATMKHPITRPIQVRPRTGKTEQLNMTQRQDLGIKRNSGKNPRIRARRKLAT